MRVMSDEPRDHEADTARRADHLRVVTVPVAPASALPARPRSIGRVIAQTALIADGAVARRRAQPPVHEGRGVGRLLGRYR